MKKVLLAIVLAFTLLTMYSCVGMNHNRTGCQATKVGNHR